MVNLGILGTAVAPAGIIIDKIQAGFYWLMLLIDTTLAWAADALFDIFFALAKVNIFTQEAYADIVKRVYIVLGLIMLFALAYSLLKAVINPDEFAKGEYSFPKLIQNVVVSLIIIAVLPTVFSMATNFQNAILNEGTIPKIILGKDTATDSCDAGRSFSYHILSAFLFPNKEWCTENNYSLTKDSDGKAVTDSNASECAENIKTSDGSIFHAGQSLSEITNEFLNDTSKPSIKIFVNFNEAAVDGEMTYLVVISTIAMIFLLIAILNFCFDMAIRIFRLIFFEIIAPIPVICRIIPGGKMKDVFGTWVKKTLSTFADIFIRLVVIYFVLFLFDKINEARQSIVLPCLNVVTSKLAWALVYMGLIAFMRQAPKVICDLFHLDPGNLKMGFGDLKDKFAEGGGFAAINAVGSAITGRSPAAFFRGLRYGVKNKDFKSIGHSSNYRQAVNEARASGATRYRMTMDRLRRSMGFETLYEYESRNVDAEIERINAGINEKKRPIDELQHKIDGNQKFIDLKGKIKDRAEDQILKEDSDYTVPSFSFDGDFERDDHGNFKTDAQGRKIRRKIDVGSNLNLKSISDFLNSTQGKSMSAEEIQKFNMLFQENKKKLTERYINDNLDSNTASDSKISGFITDIRSQGVLDGLESLDEASRNTILENSTNFWSTVKDVSDNVEELNRGTNRQIVGINQSVVADLERVENLKKSKEEGRFIATKASSDVTGKPPGDLRPHGDGRRRPPRDGGGPPGPS